MDDWRGRERASWSAYVHGRVAYRGGRYSAAFDTFERATIGFDRVEVAAQRTAGVVDAPRAEAFYHLARHFLRMKESAAARYSAAGERRVGDVDAASAYVAASDAHFKAALDHERQLNDQIDGRVDLAANPELTV